MKEAEKIKKLEQENKQLHELIDALFDAAKRISESLDITRELLRTQLKKPT